MKKRSYDVVIKLSRRGSYHDARYENSSFGTSRTDLSGTYTKHFGHIVTRPLTELGYVYKDFDDANGVNQLNAVEEKFSEELRRKIDEKITDAFWQLEKQISDLEEEYQRKANEYLVENFRPSRFPNFKKLEA